VAVDRLVQVDSLDDFTTKERDTGVAAIRNGQVAVVTPLAGMNTRGGMRCRALTPLQGTSLTPLDIHFRSLEAIRRTLYPRLQAFVITSQLFHDDISRWIEASGGYGFNGDLHVVEAPSYPFSIPSNNSAPGQLVPAPFGHGHTFKSMGPHLKVLDDMGVGYIYYWHVSNLLERILDPSFIGHAILRGFGSSVKVVDPARARPHMGRVGVDNARPVAIPHHDASLYGNWEDLHGNLGSKFFCLSNVRKTLDQELPTYQVRHYLGIPSESNRQFISRPETSILDILNLCQPLGPVLINPDQEYFPFKSATAADFVEVVSKRVERGLHNPPGFEGVLY